MSRSAMLLRLAMEPLTAGSIVAVCDCCPALHPLTAAAAISTHTAAAARPRGTDEFTMLSGRAEMGAQTVGYPCHTSILRCPRRSWRRPLRSTITKRQPCLDESLTGTRTGAAKTPLIQATDPVRAAGRLRDYASDGLFRLRELGNYRAAESR